MKIKFEKVTFFNAIKKLINKLFRTNFELSKYIVGIDCGSKDFDTVTLVEIKDKKIKILSSDTDRREFYGIPTQKNIPPMPQVKKPKKDYEQ